MAPQFQYTCPMPELSVKMPNMELSRRNGSARTAKRPLNKAKAWEFPALPSHTYSHRAPVVVDLFAGAGGLSYGLAMAGFRPLAAVEHHPHAALTYQRNHPGSVALVSGVQDVTAESLLGIASSMVGKDIAEGGLDLLVGGPPCQGFSTAGEKQIDDPRNDLFRHFVRLIGATRPTMFMFENVNGLVSMYGGKAFKRVLDELKTIPGYKLSHAVLNAEEFGVPSLRRRVFIVGTLRGSEFMFPNPTHGHLDDGLFDNQLCSPVTVAEAIGDLDFLSEPGEASWSYRIPAISAFQQWARQGSGSLYNHESTKHSERVMQAFSHVPIGGGAGHIPEEIRSKKDGLLRLDPEGVSRAILSAPEDLIHFSRNRIPTVREQARLQSFPDCFVFMGQRTSGNQNRKSGYCSQTQQVGNAVPPLLAYALGRQMREHLGR